MKSGIIKRSIELNGHKTSVSLEDDFWNGFHEIAATTNTSLQQLLRSIDAERGPANLSSAIRVFVFSYFRAQTQQRAVSNGYSDHAQPPQAAQAPQQSIAG